MKKGKRKHSDDTRSVTSSTSYASTTTSTEDSFMEVGDKEYPVTFFAELYNMYAGSEISKKTQEEVRYENPYKEVVPSCGDSLFENLMSNYGYKTDKRISKEKHQIAVLFKELSGLHMRVFMEKMKMYFKDHDGFSCFDDLTHHIATTLEGTIVCKLFSELMEYVFILNMKISREVKRLAKSQVERIVCTLTTMSTVLRLSTDELNGSHIFKVANVKSKFNKNYMGAYIYAIEATLSFALGFGDIEVQQFKGYEPPTSFVGIELPSYGCSCMVDVSTGSAATYREKRSACIYHVHAVKTWDFYATFSNVEGYNGFYTSLYADYMETLHTLSRKHLNTLEMRRVKDRRTRVNHRQIREQLNEDIELSDVFFASMLPQSDLVQQRISRYFKSPDGNEYVEKNLEVERSIESVPLLELDPKNIEDVQFVDINDFKMPPTPELFTMDDEDNICFHSKDFFDRLEAYNLENDENSSFNFFPGTPDFGSHRR